LAAVVVERALSDAGSGGDNTGVMLGSAYGNVDDSAAFMHRIFEKGARAASPADFPNLVPSSPVGHVSIYLGLRGPTFTTADLATSGESAFVQAAQLIAVGEGTRIVAGAVEPKSDIVERVLATLFAHTASQAHAIRFDTAAAIVVESAHEAHARGGRVLARVSQWLEWRTEPMIALASLGGPQTDRAEVVLARANGGTEELLLDTPWGSHKRVVCAPALGESDGLGAVALVVAAARIATERVDEALVLGLSQGRGYAVVLTGERPACSSAARDRTQ
jgi:3-oxoacyl-[acyl-carrier-protein] synthase II